MHSVPFHPFFRDTDHTLTTILHERHNINEKNRIVGDFEIITDKPATYSILFTHTPGNDSVLNNVNMKFYAPLKS